MIRLNVRPLLLLAALVWASAYVRAADTLPHDISDSAFWKLVEDLSESGGTFESDNWISNETGIQTVIPRLKPATRPDGAYLGVGPEQNFTFIATIRPKIAFIIDIRRQNTVEHLVYKALFEMSATRADFVSRLFSHVRPAGLTRKSSAAELFRAFGSAPRDDMAFRNNLEAVKQRLVNTHKFGLTAEDMQAIERVLTVFREFGPTVNYNSGGSPQVAAGLPSYTELMTATDPQGREGSYLATEDHYQFVRDMQRRNLIVPVTGDFSVGQRQSARSGST